MNSWERSRPCVRRSGLGSKLMVVAEHTRQLPAAALFLPDMGELRDLGQTARFVLEHRVEAVDAGLDGAVVVDRIDLHRLGHEFARGEEIGADRLALALVVRRLVELLARG